MRYSVIGEQLNLETDNDDSFAYDWMHGHCNICCDYIYICDSYSTAASVSANLDSCGEYLRQLLFKV